VSSRLSPRAAALLGWFADRHRDLPWRRTRDPWAVLVSELMLQQTQVARVVPRFEAFLDRFPSPAACAASSVGDVVTRWAGLGYNRRAVNLHRAASAVVADHGGAVPAELDALLELPGIGPYTARAVLAFAFERDVGVLDVNAARVLSRLTGRPVAQIEADRLVPPGRGWTWNQAVLDLGATVCRPRPDCAACPLAGGACAWETAGRPAPDPWLRSKSQSRFPGSDRQGRGRLIDALRNGPVDAAHIAPAMGWPRDPDRAVRVAATLLADGLAMVDASGTWRLPSSVL
jgi:A/G-specific adenine glycosylase